MSGERSRNALATPSVRFIAPGPSVETHTAGLRASCPAASAMNAATASCRTRMNSMPTFRAASMKSRISPPGRPNIRSTPASRSVVASTSAQVGMIGRPIIAAARLGRRYNRRMDAELDDVFRMLERVAEEAKSIRIEIDEEYLLAIELAEALPSNQTGCDKTWVWRMDAAFRSYFKGVKRA